MKHLLRLLVLSISVLPVWVLADTPVGPMNYQGRLLDDGVPVGFPTPTAVNFVVKVYDAESGGTLKYQETHSGVTVDDGVYSFLVGTQPKDAGDSTWSVELWNCCSDLFMEITANGDVLLPRSRLAAAPYAFQANLALTTNNALALGGVSAGQYQNTLAAICAAGKGKWLASLNKCLGSGAVITNQAIPASDGLNYTNLELINVNLTGTTFPSNADFTGTIFKNSTISFSGFPSNATLYNTRFENITATTPLLNPSATQGSIFKNINMTGFTFTGSSLWNSSVAELSACPASLPANYGCAEQFTGSGRYFVYGPYMNFSSTSALATSTSYGTTLQLRSDAFSGASSLQAANFSAVRIPTHLNNINLTQANFNDAILEGLNLSNTNLNNSTFDRAKITRVNFTNASIAFVPFKGAEITLTAMQNGDYTDAKLEQVTLTGVSNQSTFNNTVFIDTNLSIGFLDPVVFNNSYFTGTIHITQGSGFNAPAIQNVTFSNSTFSKAILASEIRYQNSAFPTGLACTSVVFNNNTFRGFEMRFNQSGIAAGNLTFTNNKFGATVFSGNLLNASFSGSSVLPGASLFDGLIFKSATVCPNGTTQNNANGDYFTCGNAGQTQSNW